MMELMNTQLSKILEFKMIESQTTLGVELIVERYGSMTNYIKAQLLTNPTFVALSPDEDNYEDKFSFLQINSEEAYLSKYGSVSDKVYQQYGLERPNFEMT
jgi:hypothetical protein